MAQTKEMLVSRPQDEKNDLVIQDEEITKNLIYAVPHRLEKAWRLYGGKGKIPPTADKLTSGKFRPDFVPCIYPVKVDKTKAWDYVGADGQYSNVQRCNHVIPPEHKGKEAQTVAEIHCEEHLDWYFETHGRKEKGTGRLRPPGTTQIDVPRWVETVGEDPDLSERERRVLRMKTRMAEKKVTKEEVADAVNEHYGTKRGKSRKEE